MCCDSWGRRESDMTEQLNCTEGFNTGLPQWPSRVCLSVQEEQKAWVQSLGKDEHLGGRGGSGSEPRGSRWENLMDGGAQQAVGPRAIRSQTRLND